MKSIFKGSLQRKLLGVMLATTLVALVAALGAMIAYDSRAYHQGWIADINAQAELIARTTAPALEFDDARMAKENLALLRFQPKILSAAIYGPRGERFATYSAPGAATAFPALPKADGVAVEAGEVVVFKRITTDGRSVGTVYLRARYELLDRVWSYAGIALLVALFGMSVALIVSHWLQRLITRPILDVGAAAREVVGRRDYSRRVQPASDAEVGALVDAFNAMMSEIEQRTRALEASNLEKEKEVEERRLAQQEVMRLNSELEGRVRQRTAQLESSNADLVLATAAAREANSAKSEFLSNMSHELRTPLNAIIGFGQILAASKPGSQPPERTREFVDHIVEAGRHLLALINDILNLAQIEAGRLTVSLEAVAVEELLAECRALTEQAAAKRGIRLSFPDEAGLHVCADRTRLKQVLLNLLSNAVKYNREAGSVLVFLQPGPERVRISVQDTGQGLTPQQLESLFQPFNRLGQETGVQEGTGIGLVLTKHLVELMGGTLGVTSTPGAGSVFWVEFDLTTAERPGSTTPVSQLSSSADPGAVAKPPVFTVLCVEDNASSLALAQELMRSRKNVRLLSAGNGQIGVEMARLHRPDLILMDNNMPVMNGRDAQSILRRDPRTAQIPVIAVSANAMPGAAADALAAGFFRYVTKPIEPVDFNDAVDCGLAVAARQRGR